LLAPKATIWACAALVKPNPVAENTAATTQGINPAEPTRCRRLLKFMLSSQFARLAATLPFHGASGSVALANHDLRNGARTSYSRR